MLRSEKQVEQLVSEHHGLVQYQVNRYLKRYAVRSIEREDLVSWGLLGLVKAARVWDPQRGAFATVACNAIEWMLHRAAGKEWRHERGLAPVSLDTLSSGDDGGTLQDRFVDQLADEQHLERDLLENEHFAEVRGAVAGLPQFERRLIERHFYDDVSIARIAEELGLSRQRVGERRRVALRQLRTALSSSIDAAR